MLNAENSALCSDLSKIHDEMVTTFCDYARINSQSAYPSDGSAGFTMTTGQKVMAERLVSDINRAIVDSRLNNLKPAYICKDNYVYFTIPASNGSVSPVIGISCHLDVTPEVDFGNKSIVPIVTVRNGHTIIHTDGSTLLGADDKCGCTIAISLIRALLSDDSPVHGEVQFVFCPNEDIGLAAERIDTTRFNPEMIFDIDGEEPYKITDSNFTARGLNLLFKGNSVHPSDAKSLGLGDAVGAASMFIAGIPTQYRPEHSEGKQGYIHPWNLTRNGQDILVETRIRYFDHEEGDLFDRVLKESAKRASANHPNVDIKCIYEGIQYENVAYTLHPDARGRVEKGAHQCGLDIEFIPSRGGTTASMFAAKGLKGGMCVFSGQHNAHSLSEYADINEMIDAYRLMLYIISE